MSERVQSPVTGGPAVFSDELQCASLIDRYRNDWGLDVAAHFAGMHSLSLYRCKDTGYRFFHPPSLAGEAAFYDEFWALENPTIHRPRGGLRDDWQFALDRVHRHEKLLDVGCADGAFLESARQICDARGIDENQQGCLVAQGRGLNVTCATVSDYAQAHPDAFDTVVASQVLEHVYDVSSFMLNLKTLIHPGGRMILSVPNNQPFFMGWSKYEPLNNPPHHIGWWNADSLKRMATHFGLIVREVAYLGEPDRFAVQVFRRTSHLTGIAKGPNQLSRKEWLKIFLATPLGVALTLVNSVRTPGSKFAWISIVLEKPAQAATG